MHCAGATVLLVAAMASSSQAGDGAAWAVAILPAGEEFVLEIADDPRERAIGYMFREAVGPNEGMLFVFDGVDHHGIWMKNCRVSLDIIWLDEVFRVVHQARDRTPCPEVGPCPTMVPPVAARYVLEIAGGGAQRAGLRNGDTVVVLWEGAAR